MNLNISGGDSHDVIICVYQMVIPMSRFLEPDETNVELLKMYCDAVLNGTVTARWSPVMYLIAVHHLNRFIYTVDSAHRHIKYTMIRRFTSSRDEASNTFEVTPLGVILGWVASQLADKAIALTTLSITQLTNQSANRPAVRDLTPVFAS